MKKILLSCLLLSASFNLQAMPEHFAGQTFSYTSDNHTTNNHNVEDFIAKGRRFKIWDCQFIIMPTLITEAHFIPEELMA